ncbi:hypothetical protein MWU58_11510 [Flavobacteriaceae bacterium S0825]|uniref:hypothetical protein n=1 Tax=Gaetbulibacter sp. S0825 TaxID=2720084 RepID=UPI00142FCD5E|nr:hypothetical protein [Gaetbulibacter sp. S0825]MCK0109923.1 hypothetical protein [Flavobacteriaceae bacterium S0825]NIX65552.1 hypothetical protein [Gaetbulibacter sp. S0825]
MKDHYQFTDEEFESQFLNCTLDSSIFNHEAHIRLAWIHINKYGIEQALINLDSQLYSYVCSLGAEDKYNKTVTIAAVKAVYHFMQKSNSNNFKDFILEHPRLKTNFKELLDKHYSIDIFNSDIAKSSFLEPNLLPFT